MTAEEWEIKFIGVCCDHFSRLGHRKMNPTKLLSESQFREFILFNLNTMDVDETSGVMEASKSIRSKLA